MAFVSVLRQKNAATQCNLPILIKNTKDKSCYCDLKPENYKTELSLSGSRLVAQADKMHKRNPQFKTESKKTATVSTQCAFLPLVRKDTEPGLPPKVNKTFKSSETQCCLRDGHVMYITPMEIKPIMKDKIIQTDWEPPTAVNVTKNIFLSSVYDVLCQDPNYYCKIHFEIKTDFRGEEFISVYKYGSIGILGGKLKPISLTIGLEGECLLSVLFKKVEVCNIMDSQGGLDRDKLENLLKYMLPSSGYVFCSGINVNLIKTGETHASIICHEYPIVRYQSNKCEVYFKTQKPTNKVIKQCEFCKYSTNCMTKSTKRKLAETPFRKCKRQSLSSNFSIEKLTPRSKKVRITRIRKAKNLLNKKKAKLEAKLKTKEVDLSSEQSEEMGSNS